MKNKDVSSYIDDAAAEQVALLKELRKLIFATVPEVLEQYKWSRPVYALEKDFCYIKTAKNHVSFGFFEFDKIQTNKNKIEGTGKSMRHIKLNNIKQIDELQVGQMIKEVLV